MNVIVTHGLTWIAATGLCSPVAAAEGFESLFDGKTLNGWINAQGSYAVEDGTIVCKRGEAGQLLTEREFDNFRFKFEFRLTPGANNGLAIRAPKTGDAAYTGMELQILDNNAPQYAELEAYQYHGSVYGVAPAKRGHLKPPGQWNHQEVLVVDRHITVRLNDATILDVELDEAAPGGKTIDRKSHPGLARTSGHIGFLGHGDEVAFREIYVEKVPAEK